tara:strand:- start:81 stop:479 length:399 start_codon:yes stop_codon:yes gene_type:complete
MSSFHFRKWDNTPVITHNFNLTTKMQNFDSYYSHKSILGFILNLTSAKSTDYFYFRIFYRTGENSSWHQTGRTYSKNLTGGGTTQFKEIFTIPLKNVVNFQLSIRGRTSGDIALNDISVLYRKYRDVSESQL